MRNVAPQAFSDTPEEKAGKTRGRQGDLGDADKRILWGRAGGRCQRCNVDLGVDQAGWRPYNLSENAHIVASAKDGTRGDTLASAELADQIDNHLLLCRHCHKVIDAKLGEELFPVEALRKLKFDQEALVTRLMDLAQKRQSVAIYLSAAVGTTRLQPLDIGDINMAIVNANMVPALRHPIHINLFSLLEIDTLDSDPEFWRLARKKLHSDLETKVLENTHLKLSQVEHFSVFGMAPIPVLALLGSLLPDTRQATPFEQYQSFLYPGKTPLQDEIETEIHQYDRDLGSWSWPTERTSPEPSFRHELLSGHADHCSDVAVLCELTFPTHKELVDTALPDAPLYKLTVDRPAPNLIQAYSDVQRFMQHFRELLIHIERTHGHQAHVHVFGTLPVSCAVALGRVRVKGALPITVYHLQQTPARYEPGVVLADL